MQLILVSWFGLLDRAKQACPPFRVDEIDQARLKDEILTRSSSVYTVH